MSYEFKKLSEVEALTEVPEGATVLAEVGGAIKRIPGSGLGSGANILRIYNDFDGNYTANMSYEELRAHIVDYTLDGCLYKDSDHLYAGGQVSLRIRENYISLDWYSDHVSFMIEFNADGTISESMPS